MKQENYLFLSQVEDVWMFRALHSNVNRAQDEGGGLFCDDVWC